MCAACNSSSKTEMEKDILFIEGTMPDDGNLTSGYFFKIDMRKREVWMYPHQLLADEGISALTCVGSCVYNVGGLPAGLPTNTSSVYRKGHRHTGLSYLDLSEDLDGTVDWKGGPILPYIVPTPMPCVVSISGKLYVFVWKQESSAVGVYDPTLNKWDTLLPPPGVKYLSVESSYSAVADYEKNRILVNFRKTAPTFAYYPADNRWEPLEDKLPWSPKLVFFNGVFYHYNPEHEDMFTAFDLAKKEWLILEFTSEVPYEVWRYDYQAMLYLGNGIVCLTTYVEGPSDTNILVAKFRFKRAIEGVVRVTPLPLETYTLGVYCSIINYIPI